MSYIERQHEGQVSTSKEDVNDNDEGDQVKDTKMAGYENDKLEAGSAPEASEPPNAETYRDTDQPTDVEALAQIPSNRPVHSVFGKKQKAFIVFIAGLGAFFSPLTASIYFPALNAIASDLQVSNELVNLTMTTYMIFQGLAPTFMGDLADATGRRPVYILCFVIYIVACIGIAVCRNYATLIVVRCIQSSGSSATIALAYGVVADIATSSERGTYMSLVGLGAMSGPAVGPIIGGLIAQFLGWRAIFWFLAILAGVYFLFAGIAFPETARNVVGNGSITPSAWNMSVINWWETRRSRRAATAAVPSSPLQDVKAHTTLAQNRRFRVPNPWGAIRIIFEKDSGILLLYASWIYTAFYCVISSLPQLFAEIYGFNDLQIGFSFIPFGVGCICASLCNGRVLDYNYRRIARKRGIKVDKKRGEDMRHFPIEQVRLQIVFPLLYVGVVVIILYGWILEMEAPLAAPLVLLFCIGFFLNGSFNAMSTMLIDLYPTKPSTATAANNLMRCWMGAGGTAVILPIVDALGRGWAFTLVGLLVLASSFMPWMLLKWGPKWREERFLRDEKERKRKEEKEERKRAGEEDIEERKRRESDNTLRDEKQMHEKDSTGNEDGDKSEDKKTQGDAGHGFQESKEVKV